MTTSIQLKSAQSNLLETWKGPIVKAVNPESDQHSIHSYFNTCPESPDGRWVLFYRSTTPEAYIGDIVIRARQSGEERVLAKGITVEDAHRAACQQWVCNGQEVVFHDFRNDEWVVVAVNIESLNQRILARGRQVCWGQPKSNWVPLYGPHSNPGKHRNLEILNVETGEIQTALSVDDVVKAYPEAISKKYGEMPLSIFFPILSPDLKRVIFKVASPAGGDFRSKKASIRHFLIAYDLEQRRFLFVHESWGHPAWHPDSKTLINTRSVLVDSDNGSIKQLPGLPNFPGTHPTVSPDGKLFITDTKMEPFGGQKGEWGIVVGDIEGNQFDVIHRFDGSNGAASWRVSHPHPAMSADGERIYFNTNSGGFTRLFVAERSPRVIPEGSQ